jgi:hypothetical protein
VSQEDEKDGEALLGQQLLIAHVHVLHLLPSLKSYEGCVTRILILAKDEYE